MALTHNRISYQNQAIFAGPSPATGGHFYWAYNTDTPGKNSVGVGPDFNSGWNLINQLHRIQSVSYSWNVNRTNVNQFGELAAIDRPILDTPTVSLGFSYLLANMYNESGLGFHTQGLYNALSGILNKSEDERNYFLKITPEGTDAKKNTVSDSNTYTIGFGNCFLTSYRTQGSVNSFPSVDVAFEGLNLSFDTGTSGNIPSIFPYNGAQVTGYNYNLPIASGSAGTGLLSVSVLRPGDATISIFERHAQDEGIIGDPTSPYATAGVAINDAHIQSYNLSFNLGRTALSKLGSRYAISREINFPVDISLSVDAIVTKLTTGSLSDIVGCDKSYDVHIDIKKPSCPGEAQPVVARYIVKNAKLDSQSYNGDIGSNQTVSLTWSSQLGGPAQTGIGLYMSGISSATAS